jgi:3'-phosphoadenosine 5'-phosphosulfate sulfotransferase (PAPS reductase)/FAD synthetase
MILHVVSVSTGKDSTATALYAKEECDPASLRFVSADVGNEHDEFLPYIAYLEGVLGAPIKILRREFTREWWSRRDYVRDVYPEKLVLKDGYTPEEAGAIVERCLKVLELGPTGNPYLDLCIIKGRFPSRKAQFCTQFLKTEPLVEYQMGLIESGEAAAVWSWQGVRAEESDSRRHLGGTGGCAKFFEEVGGGLYIYRPIVRWRAQDTFDAMAICGVEPNPLYRQGMSRVGCMPCINAAKDEIRQIAARFPEHLDRIERWEEAVKQASKGGAASFFPDPDRDAHLNKRGIRNVIEWSKTSRGGKQYALVADEEPACASAYGLCE